MCLITAAWAGQEIKPFVLITPHKSNPPFIQGDGAGEVPETSTKVTDQTSRYHHACSCPRSDGIIIFLTPSYHRFRNCTKATAKLHPGLINKCITRRIFKCSQVICYQPVSSTLQLGSSVSIELTLYRHASKKAWIKSMIRFNLTIMSS